MGEGTPKICVPMTSTTTSELVAEIYDIKKTKADIVEWRVDYFADVDDVDKVVQAAMELRAALGEFPMLFTFRSQKEGGEREILKEAYVELNCRLAASGQVDAVDMELFSGDEACRTVIKAAHDNGVKVIMSSHDFGRTPHKVEIEDRLMNMHKLGADIPKIALMPHSAADVLTVLEVTLDVSTKLANQCPIITMSMGALGAVSRVSGEVFGSCMTFGTVKQASAPGQLVADSLYDFLQALQVRGV